MPIEVDTFVDTHCHMFTVADVPLHTTISKNIHHPLLKLFGGVLAGPAFKKVEPFIKFFDQESIQNVEQIVDQVKKAIQHDDLDAFKINTTETILTPLVMDFDKNGKVTKFEAQLKRLTDAAAAYVEKPPVKNVKVLPFVGLDPRKVIYKKGTSGTLRSLEEIKTEVVKYLKERKLIGTDERRAKENLRNGDVIGVKLYPPLGFDVYPDDANDRAAYLAVYETLAELEVPITVHCQSSSYNLSEDNLDAFTSPGNWRRVLETNATLAKLRINFGHFGGETGVADAVNWSDGGDDDSSNFFATGPSHVGWTSEIIKLLLRYENTYADISAFDYRLDKCSASLLWLLAFDKAGDLKKSNDDKFSLIDKLMWGSDYPMILEKDYPDYQSFFKGFINAVIDRDTIRAKYNSFATTDKKYSIPVDGKLPVASDELLKVLVGANPVKFLFG